MTRQADPNNTALPDPPADLLSPGSLWRASQLAQAGVETLPTGYRLLDAELPGAGWPAGMLTELIVGSPGIGEFRLLVPPLRQLTRERRIVILLAPPMLPYAPALAGFGIDTDHLLVIQAPNAADRLWAIEQVLRSASFGALLAWLPQQRCRPEHLRRMQAAARGAGGPVFLLREPAAQLQPSPAPLRLLLLPRPQQCLSVRILKRRGPVISHPLTIELPVPSTAIRLPTSRATSNLPAGSDTSQTTPEALLSRS
ncbi:MAG: translesion DNA synthesis-associated protein ImuA [Burkholderiaceae bacterium]